jgi:hypothetical protein
MKTFLNSSNTQRMKSPLPSGALRRLAKIVTKVPQEANLGSRRLIAES